MSPFASAPAKKTSVGPRPDDRQARGPSRVSNLSDSMSIKHTRSRHPRQTRFACWHGLLPLAWRQTSEHRVDRLPECRSGHIGVAGARDEQTAQQRQTPDEVNENVGVKVDDLASRD